jgi:ferredoxin
MKIVIDQELCCGSGECVKVCPEKAITLVAGKAVLDESKCDFDGICIPACPLSAISYDDGEVGGCGF